MARRKLIVAVATLALIAGGGALAVASTSVQNQPEGTQYACVKPSGEIAYMQFRRLGDPGYATGRNGTANCYDGPGGVKQWSWDQQGPAGERGPAGPAGADGADGVSDYEVVGHEVTVPAGADNFVATTDCPDGKVALGGGYELDQGGTDVTVDFSRFDNLTENEDGTWGGTGWTVQIDNPGATNQVTPYVSCATVN